MPDAEAATTVSGRPAAGASWSVVGSSVVGTSHVAHQIPCQDAHAFVVRPDGALLVAVADGAGSADRSDEGARISVERALEVIDSRLDAAHREGRALVAEDEWRTVMSTAFRNARRRLEDRAASDSVDIRAFACTLTCAVATEDQLVVGQVGDGAVVARGLDGELITASEPQHGDYANETNFLTMPEALDRLALSVLGKTIDALAATTDGLLRLATTRPDHAAHGPFFEPLLAFAARSENPDRGGEELAAFLASDRVNRRTDDDKTLVLAVRRRPATIAVDAAQEAEGVH